MLYFPLLRTKKGEMDALLALNGPSAAYLHPVLQIPPPDLDEDDNPVAPSAAYTNKVLGSVKKILVAGSPLSTFLDPAPAGLPTALLDALLNAIATQGGTPGPVFYLNGSADYAKLYKQHFGPISMAILRLREPDLTPTLPATLKAALTRYGLLPDQVLVMLDAGDISAKTAPVTLFATAMMGATFQLQAMKVAGIIIASAALPAKDEKLKKWVPTQYVRRELELFSSVKTATGYDLHFADYATGNVIDAPTPSRLGAPKVRYTLAGAYEVLRGEKASTGRGGKSMTVQYETISKHVVGHSGYSGRLFSWGDTHIHNSSQPTATKRGNATTWVTANTSHHLELVVSMLPAM
jgi:hypothetical protein